MSPEIGIASTIIQEHASLQSEPSRNHFQDLQTRQLHEPMSMQQEEIRGNSE